MNQFNLTTKMHKITLNGSVHKDLSKIIKAVSSIKAARPFAPVSILVSEEETASGQSNAYSAPFTNHYFGQSILDQSNQYSSIKVFVAGTGTVGAEFVRQLFALDELSFSYILIGICNSRKVLLNDNGLGEDAVDELANARHLQKTNWDNVISFLKYRHTVNLIFVDATGSKEVSNRYEDLLDAGIHVVTASKLATTESHNRFKLLSSYEQKNTFFRYEATAGAGLPVIQTIKNLRLTGDRVTKISGVVSGTMTYIFDALQRGISFSEAVKTAAEKGYAEPDPRDDLSGEDVARKFLILARVAGYSVERSSFEAENQTPDALRGVTREEFLEKLSEYDTEWAQRINEARARNEVLRYVGELSNGEIKVGVKSVPIESPLGSLTGTDNQISIYTNFYKNSPITIQGPGAGREVTAQIVLSEVLQIGGRLIQGEKHILAK